MRAVDSGKAIRGCDYGHIDFSRVETLGFGIGSISGEIVGGFRRRSAPQALVLPNQWTPYDTYIRACIA